MSQGKGEERINMIGNTYSSYQEMHKGCISWWRKILQDYMNTEEIERFCRHLSKLLPTSLYGICHISTCGGPNTELRELCEFANIDVYSIPLGFDMKVNGLHVRYQGSKHTKLMHEISVYIQGYNGNILQGEFRFSIEELNVLHKIAEVLTSTNDYENYKVIIVNK